MILNFLLPSSSSTKWFVVIDIEASVRNSRFVSNKRCFEYPYAKIGSLEELSLGTCDGL